MANNRCPDCNKFVSTVIQVSEINIDDCEELEIDDEGIAHTTATVTLAKCCADCSSELATADVTVDIDIPINKDIEWESSN